MICHLAMWLSIASTCCRTHQIRHVQYFAMQRIYLDNNATTQPAPEVVAAVHETLKQHWANPSSVHRFGQSVRQRVDLARAGLASLINCRDRELIFTSGGTEANNLALRGILDRCLPTTKHTDPPRGLLFTTKTEHTAIRQSAEHLQGLGITVVYLPVDRLGRVNANDLAAALNEHAHGNCLPFVTIQWANNETGVIQPIEELVAVCQAHQGDDKPKVIFHTDATQAVSKLPVDVKRIPIDLLTLSAHKFHGPKGVGALYARPGIRLHAQIRGGSQERENRGGTENTPGIVGMSVAAELAKQFLADGDQIERLAALRDRFEQAIIQQLSDTVINSVDSAAPPDSSPTRLWNTSSLGFPRLESEAILLGLSERGLCASAGSACSSGSLEPSPVLLAMGIPEPVAHGSIRFSLSRYTTESEIDQAVETVISVVQKLAKTLPVPA